MATTTITTTRTLAQKAITAALTGALVFSLAACGQTTQVSTSTGTTTEGRPANGGESYAPDALTTMEVDGYWEPEPTPAPNWNTEEYDARDESGFVVVAANPLSTVSADVDTASYCNLRRMLASGYKLDEIPSGAVRIEEMLNYFDYAYDAPSGNDAFSVNTAVGACPWNEHSRLLTLGFATAPEDRTSSKGSNLVFLIDTSGSMDTEEKLDLLKDSFAVLVEQLDANDTVSIVTYAGEEEVVLDGAPGTDKKAILDAIGGLSASGSTNGEAGLEMAYKVAQDHFIKGGVNRIVMASDGDLNVGMSSESDLHDYVDKQRETGVYLSVLGFGSENLKDNKMETLADHGNGSYHYIDCIEEANKVFGEDLTANLIPFADDVKVQVEFNPAQVAAYRLIGYENREMADEDFRDDSVDAGDVGPDSQFTVCYEIVMVGEEMPGLDLDLRYGQNEGAATGSSATSDEWLACTLRYRSFDDDKVHEQQRIVDTRDLKDDPGADWRLAASVIELGMVLENSKNIGTATLESARALAEKDNSEGDANREELLRMITRAELAS